jgi:hypothetical protein
MNITTPSTSPNPKIPAIAAITKKITVNLSMSKTLVTIIENSCLMSYCKSPEGRQGPAAKRPLGV